MRDEILAYAKALEGQNPLIADNLRRIVAAEDARLRVAQTDARSRYNDDGSIEVRTCPRCNGDGIIHRPTAEARCACDGEPDGE